MCPPVPFDVSPARTQCTGERRGGIRRRRRRARSSAALDFAPEPESVARRLFDTETIAAHLRRLDAAQQEDGGWTFNWMAWSPAAAQEWRGVVTIEALRVLRANQLAPQTGQGASPSAR